jgi:hypothetical protein
MNPAAEEEATEVVRGSIGHWRRGTNKPTLGAHAPETVRQSKEAIWQRASRDDPPKRSECRETFGPPVKPHGAQDSAGCPRDESRVVSWEHTRYGYTLIVQVADVGRTHRASCPPGGRKAVRGSRALAGRKLASTA